MTFPAAMSLSERLASQGTVEGCAMEAADELAFPAVRLTHGEVVAVCLALVAEVARRTSKVVARECGARECSAPTHVVRWPGTRE